MRVLVWSPVLEELPSLGSFLVRADLTPIEAEDGERIVELAAAHRPQVVVLDEEMPGGGLEIVRRLRQSGGAAAAVLLRTRRSCRTPLDGVIAVPRGDGAPPILAAITRLLLVPVRAAFRAYVVVEAPRRLAGPRLFEAQTIDVSVSGMKIRTSQVLRPGDRVEACFSLAPGEPLVLTAARVVRVAAEERGQYHYGIEFQGLRTGDREAIQAAVDRSVDRATVPQPSPV